MDDIVHGGEEQLTPFEERCLFWVMYVIAMGEALWQSLWTVDSPSPFADSAERHLWLLPALLALAVAVATMFFLYFAVSFGCLTGRGWGSECSIASAIPANWLMNLSK